MTGSSARARAIEQLPGVFRHTTRAACTSCAANMLVVFEPFFILTLISSALLPLG